MNPIESWLTEPGGLADRLRALRTQTGKAGKDLAADIGWPASKVSRLENGRQMPSDADITTWAQACGADDTTTQDLLHQLGELAAAHLDWKRRMRQGQAAVQANYGQLVQECTHIRHFETVYIPGLLQTAEYARRVLDEMVELHDLAVKDVAEAVAERIRRQQFLYDTSKTFEFLLAEPVLRWMLCPPAIMRGQLDRLQTVIGMSNIRFGIVPMGRELRTAPQNSFQIYDDMAIVETFVGETTHRGAEATAYAQALDRLWAEAVIGEDARHLIVQASTHTDTRSA